MFELEEIEGKVKVEPDSKKPKIGFLGVGWIGKNRMEAIHNSNMADITAVCDSNPDAAAKVCGEIHTRQVGSYEELLELDLDGIVIATPSAMHKEQAVQALQRGLAVFCQKPLAKTQRATKEIVETARKNDCLLMADFSYRNTAAMQKLQKVISKGELGDIFAVNLVFHNAYGPDKSWYYTPALSGGGCVMDLGVHLVDLLFWLNPAIEVQDVVSGLYSGGKLIKEVEDQVEDYASSIILLSNGVTVNLTCSWNISAGCDAVIEASFYGTKGGVSFSNVAGSFYDFKAERYTGTDVEVLSFPPDHWSGRTAVNWMLQLSKGNHYNASAETYIKTAAVIDKIYGRSER